jgi:peptidoglycan/LPS O-acetylase OafA/YrhL
MINRKKIEYLDGLRGWAALSVLNGHWVHFLLPAFLGPNETLLKFITMNANFAVYIFYFLSGRVIENSILKKPTIRNVFDTAIRRIFRILLPVVWIWTYHFIAQRLGVYDFLVSSEEIKNLYSFHYLEIFRIPFALSDIITVPYKVFVSERPSLDDMGKLYGFDPAW